MFSTPCAAGYFHDPLHYCNPGGTIPGHFIDVGTVYPYGGAAVCWTGLPDNDVCRIGLSNAFPVTYIDISPRQATVFADGQLQFTTNLPFQTSWSLAGPGMIDDNGLYRAPATITGTQTATVTACDIYAAPFDCVTATLTLSPLKVTVSPAVMEVLPGLEQCFTASVDPSTPSLPITWKLEDPTGFATITPSGTPECTGGKFKAPANDQINVPWEITVKGCVKPDANSEVCGTAKARVPKLEILITAPKAELTLEETLQLTAFVQGSPTPKLKWTPPTDGLLTQPSPADPFVVIYQAPPYPVSAGGVDIEACLEEIPTVCKKYHIKLPVPLRLDDFNPIVSDTGRWQAGTMTWFTIKGQGFGPNPAIALGDLEVTVTQVTETSVRGQVRITVPTTGIELIVAVEYPNGFSTLIANLPIPVEPATIGVAPPAPEIRAGDSVQLNGTCLTSTTNPCTSLEVPSWSASVGTVNPTLGLITLYTAPASVTSTTTAAISACWNWNNASRCAPAQVKVLPPAGPVVDVNPKTVSLKPGETQQFTATVSNSTNTAVTWSIDPIKGAITQTGLYTAPTPFSGPATVKVTATSQADATRFGIATVTLIPAPLTLTSTPSPASVNFGATLSWTATASGGTPGTIQYALFRKKTGAADWTPPMSNPAWQSGNIFTWTTGVADIGTWEIRIGARDANNPLVLYDPGAVKILDPIVCACPPANPTQVEAGTPITLVANGSGGTAPLQYAFFRRRVGTSSWIPSVTTPNWQASNLFTWTPALADVGLWEFYVWLKDVNTPPTANVYGYAAGYPLGTVEVFVPLSLTSNASPASVNHGTAITWTATANGGTGTGRQYALFRKRSGTTTWIPLQTSPAWQPSNVLSWIPAAADVGTWDVELWVKDSLTASNGRVAKYNPGSVQVMSPLSLTGTGSPAYATANTAITWTATASGGTGVGRQYAFFRRRPGAPAWTPVVTAPAWQTSNVLSWTPTVADVGTWETYIWVKDSGTPPTQNTYGYGAGYNPGPVQVVAPLDLTSTPSPASAYANQAITWTLSATGGVPSTIQYAWGRRRVGTTAWNPPAPVWQSSSIVTWTPTAAETGSWELGFVVRDSLTPPTMNGSGYADYHNPGNVQVVTPLTVTGTGSPASATYGNTLSWTATASGGTGVGRQFAFFRRRAGTSPWTPSVNTPAWQTSNVITWTPTSADVGTWETYIWVKDSATPPTMNTYGYAAGYNPGPVQIVGPLGLTCTSSPALATYGSDIITWTATATGGVPATTQYALFRKKVGTSAWIPALNTPTWQTTNLLSWGTPSAADVGTWEISIWVRDGNTPPTQNTYGYAASCNPGNVQVVAPLAVTGSGSPASHYHGNSITWTATGSGGTGAGRMYAFFRKKVGTTNWIPAVTAPAWQSSNVMSWTPAAADVGTWETSIWFKDANTPANANGYGFGAYYNPGPVQVFAHPTVSGTGSPSWVNPGTTITWTANGSGGTGAARQYAFFRKKVGTANWIPAITSPAWQTSNVMSWAPTSADLGTWETSIWLKDATTPPTMNGYGYAAYYNPGPLEVVGPLSVTCGNPPVSATYGTPVTWSGYASGGHAPTLQYAFFRRRVGSGTAGWIPAVTSPAWQTSNSFTWTPSSADVGTWETYVWVRDGFTPANMNTYGYAAGCNSGTVQVVAPLSLTGTGSPGSVDCGTPITWIAYANGGYPPTRQYALFRKLAGTSNWIPAVTSPAWQSSNVLSWTPSCSDLGTWEIVVWVKDGNTPPTMNGYGFAAYYNAGPVQVIEPEYHYYPPTGWVDGWDSLHVWGWACDPDYPWESNRVDLWTTSWQWIGSADANGWSSAPINSACGGGYAHYFDFYHWGAIAPGTEFWVWSIDLPYGSPNGDNWPIGGSGTGYEFVMP